MDTIPAPKKAKRTLRPTKVDENKRVIPKGDPRKPRWWRVNIGKKLTGTKKERRFFDTEGEAKAFIEQLELAREGKGHSAFAISQRLAAEAMRLEERLKPLGVSLTTAVDFFVRHAPQGTKKTVSDLIPDYLNTKQSPSYRYAQQISLNIFGKNFGAKPVASIFAPALERWFQEQKWNPLNKRNYMRDLSMFFNWAVSKDYIAANPLDKIDRPKVERRTPEILSVEEARKLLEIACNEQSLGLLPMYAIGLFSGVRVEELEKTTWDMIDLEEGEIRLPGRITKTRMPRNIEICSALGTILKTCTSSSGPIVTQVNLRGRRERLLSLAGIKNRRNALRHSFASYHAAKHRDPGALQQLLGQETPSVLYKHYIAAVRKTDAEQYFRLRPPFSRTFNSEYSTNSEG